MSTPRRVKLRSCHLTYGSLPALVALNYMLLFISAQWYGYTLSQKTP